MNRQLLRIMSIGVLGLALGLGFPLASPAADEAQALYNQGALHSNNGEFQEAAKSLKQALEIFPVLPRPIISWGSFRSAACSNPIRPLLT